jgi:flagellar basal body P-ring protein FlgI
MTSRTPLQAAQDKLYSIAGGSIDSNDVRASRISTRQRIEYFRSD